MDFSKIPGFAEEKDKVEFNGFWDWLIGFKSVGDLWQAQPSFIYVQAFFFIGGFVTLFHAVKNGGRYIHLWIGILLHGLVVELSTHYLSDINVFWHSQTPIIFFGRRIPLYEMVLYQVYIYPVVLAVDQLNLPRWSEPFAVGLGNLLTDYPFDIIGIKFMFWTWHDTDPNISERHYDVPWNSFYFYATFTASFIFWFHLTRRVTFGASTLTQKWKSEKSLVKELTCTVVAALLGMPGGVLLFIIGYHPLHDVHKVHSAVTFFLLTSTYLSIVCLGLRKTVQADKKNAKNIDNRLVLIYMCVYYVFFIGIAALMEPASEVSIGFHEPIGPCNETEPMTTAVGRTFYRRKYLCPTDHHETYFGWSCLPKQQPPKDGANWYTVCGTSFSNRLEYIVILSAAAILGISFFVKTLDPNSSNKKKNLSKEDNKGPLKVKKET